MPKNAIPPDLEVSEIFYWTAFLDLLTTPKFERGPIPWDSILLYAQYYNLDSSETEVLVDIINRLDNKLSELRKNKK